MAAIAIEDAQRDMAPEPALGMPVDGLVGQIQAAIGQAGQFPGLGLPGKGRAGLGAVLPVGLDPQFRCGFFDDRRAHRLLPEFTAPTTQQSR